MAKNSKSAAIRDYMAKNPQATAKDIAATFKVSTALVYGLKVKAKRRARKANRQKAVAVAQTDGLADPIKLLRKIRDLGVEAGGIKKLKAYVDLLAE